MATEATTITKPENPTHRRATRKKSAPATTNAKATKARRIPKLTLACESKSFAAALSVFAPVIHARSELAAFVVIETKEANDEVTMKGTDLETWLTTKLEQVEVTHPGAIAVPMALLREAVKKSTSPVIVLKAEGDDILRVKTDDGYVRINGRHPKDLPAPPVVKATAAVTFSTSVLGKAIEEVRYATGSDQSRYAINGVLFQNNRKRVRLVATDGRRLAVTSLGAEGTIPNSGVIVSNGCVSVLGKLCAAKSESDVLLSVASDKNNGTLLTFANEHWSIATRAVEGEFPSFDDVIPRNTAIVAQLSVAPLAAAVKQAAIVCDRDMSAVKLEFSEKQLKVGAAGLPGDAALHCPIEKYTGNPVTVGVNPRYIGDVLSLPGEVITIGINEPTKPVCITKADSVHVLMPMNVEQVIRGS